MIQLINTAKNSVSVMPILLWAGVTWMLTNKIKVLKRCDYRIIQLMSGVQWDNHVTNEVAEISKL